jgi:hypothetical protein
LPPQADELSLRSLPAPLGLQTVTPYFKLSLSAEFMEQGFRAAFRHKVTFLSSPLLPTPDIAHTESTAMKQQKKLGVMSVSYGCQSEVSNGSFEPQEFIHSHFWRLDVRNQREGKRGCC